MTLRRVPIASDLAESYFRYATYTVLDRALPDVRDGLKPVQRRIIYAMYDMGLRHDAAYKKSARIVGEVLGKYHPHGDSSVYDAMARMVQDFSLLHPLVDGQGNFGSVDGDSPAAMRYTEARPAAISQEMVADIRRDTVDWMPNFDGSLDEPELLPAVLPNLLVNGASGIAVGMATNIPPHNLNEVCQAVALVVDRWKQRDKITVDDLMMVVKGPDFPTGGMIYRYKNNGDDEQYDAIREAYATGRGRITVQGRVDVEEIAGGKKNIVIYELPSDQHGAVKKGPFIEKVAQQVRDGKIPGVTDLRDESDHEGMRIVIEVSRTAEADEVLDKLLRYTPLRGTYSVMMLALVPNPDFDPEKASGDEQDEVLLASKTMPRYLSLLETLVHFIDHRLVVIVRRSKHELAERERRLHIIEGLLTALDNIDEVIATIRRSKTQETAQTNLMKKFRLTEIQARAILDMQLRRLAALERTKLENEKKDLIKRITELKALLKSEAKRLALVKEETLAISEKYAQPRRTLVLDREHNGGAVTMSDLLTPEGPQVVWLSSRGPLCRSSAKDFDPRQSPGCTTRAAESPLFHFDCNPSDTIILVTDKGRAWRGAVGRIPERTEQPDFGLEKGETVVGGGVLKEGAYLVFLASNGKAKRTAVGDLVGVENNWNTVMGGLNGGRLLSAAVTDGKHDALLFTRQGKAIRFQEADVNPQASGSATGVAAIRVGKGDEIITADVVASEKGRSVVFVTETGWIKQVPLSEFPAQGRGGGGVQTLKVTPATGAIAAVAVGYAKGSVNVMSEKGKRHHFKMADVPKASRVARGKQLVDFGEGDAVEVAVAFAV
jgi:DNA gyrase subunit A